MLFYPKGFLVVSLAIFLLGAGLFLTADTDYVLPPRISSKLQSTKKEVQALMPALGSLSVPWYVASPQRRTAAPAQPQPVKAAEPVDKKNVTFLGSYRDQDGSATYFFKYLPTGTVFLLKSGETSKGWKLLDIQEHLFTLTGTGGRFEVTY